MEKESRWTFLTVSTTLKSGANRNKLKNRFLLRILTYTSRRNSSNNCRIIASVCVAKTAMRIPPVTLKPE